MSLAHREVFTPAELAQAAGVSRLAVDALVASGELSFVPGTCFIRGVDAVRAGHRLRALVAASPPADRPELFSILPASGGFSERRSRVPAVASSIIHAGLLVAMLSLTSGRTESAPAAEPPDPARLVFLMAPGPGGGGGGGGTRKPMPPPRLQRQGPARLRVSVPPARPERILASRRVEAPRPTPPPAPEPRPVEKPPEPLPARVLVAPVVSAASSGQTREGVIENPRGTAESQGPGAGGGTGTGQGTGNGQGVGSGLGDGFGGGTGGGLYRPGSGIEPPRLLREVKAIYTDEARRRGITGDVLLEIVVRRDGSVGEIRLVRGLGAGLDERAIAAVRQWRFSPARRRGEPVDVIVEVAVEFILR